ncbi:MAG: magnesium/cobalt transporter CorA [Promethearchaeota archaeon]
MPVSLYAWREGDDEVTVRREFALETFVADPRVNYWLRVEAPTPTEKEALVRVVGIDPLSMEDFEERNVRPKIEHYQTYDYLVFKTFSLVVKKKHEIHPAVRQVNLFYFSNIVVTLNHEKLPALDRVAAHFENGSDFLLKHGPDYLVNAMLDVVVDDYFPVVDEIDDAIEDIEEDVEDDPRPELLETLNDYRRIVIQFRRILRSEHDVLRAILRGTYPFFTHQVMKHFRDVADHVLSLIDLLEANREYVYGIRETYRSAIDARMNNIMKTLTIVSVVMLPLNLITGIYGMNFHYMPELAHPLGYPTTLLVMLFVAIALVSFFKKREWL